MAILTINDNPSISDTVIFTLNTPDAAGCYTSNPYKVDKVVVYYVERDFVSGNLGQYNQKIYDSEKLRLAEQAEVVACTSPTDENIEKAKKLRYEAESSVTTSPFYFNESKPVQIVGNEYYPAWISTDLENAFLENTGTGVFTYTWEPKGMREGDYFICWTWTPLVAGSSLSSHLRFTLKGDTQTTTSIPTHYTNPKKYKTLLDKYTPEMFKLIVSDNDRTPDVINKFNEAIALSFNTIEDLANQMVDLQDANSVHEAMIPYLSNFFNLKLKTNDTTKWRAQIKRAIPLFKMKGTKKGLIEALDLAGIKMLDIQQLWQIISSYTWQEVFTYDGNSEPEFILEKVVFEPIDYENFELYIKEENSESWITLSVDYVEFITNEGVTTMYWTGSNLSVNPIDLIEGDEIRVLYKYKEVPDPTSQAIENYIRTLPLMDQRNEKDQIYPPKNWNVRVIPENDPMFDLVIPTRHPYHDWLVYGKIRTEFPYSENIYNMEEYNGSVRNSLRPCDIEREFVDPCTACISSSYNIDLEIENLSDDRVQEAIEVLREYSPFNAVLHTMNFLGGISEFIQSPVEKIECLVTMKGSEFVVAGEAQTWFNRIMKLVETQGISREDLATSNLEYTGSGTAYNDAVMLFTPEVDLERIGMALDGSARLKILAPSPLANSFDIIEPKGKTVVVDLLSGDPIGTEPIDNCNSLFANDNTINTCAFTFNINNTSVLDGVSLCTVEKDNIFILKDSNQNFGQLEAKSLFDVEQATAINAWTVLMSDYDSIPYEILDIQPDGSLILLNHSNTLPSNTVTGVNYTLKNGAINIVSSIGDLEVKHRAKVTALNPSVTPINEVISVDNYYFSVNDVEYKVIGFVLGTDDQFYILNYTGPDLGSSTNLIVYKRLTTEKIGYFTHRGLKLEVSGNLEVSLGIQNGTNQLVVSGDGVENNRFKENFIVFIDDQSYFIAEIDGDEPSGFTTITLSGPDVYWKTIDFGGTPVNFTIYHYEKQGATIMGQQFDLPEHSFRTLDRAGRSVIDRIDRIDQDGLVTGLSLPSGNSLNDFVKQEEKISFTIQYADGSQEKGKI